jgi:anaerobic ribonucleoside-triphosphate reductase
MNKTEIDNQIKNLKEQLSEVKGIPTEIYTRIVGYYRPVKNWNKGQAAQRLHRVNFDINKIREKE